MPYTKARIAVRMPDGTYASIFYAGEMTHVELGRHLLDHYSDAASAVALVEAGDVKRLGETLADNEPIRALISGPKRYPSRSALIDASKIDTWSEWLYLRGYGEWRFCHLLWFHMVPLAQMVEQVEQLNRRRAAKPTSGRDKP